MKKIVGIFLAISFCFPLISYSEQKSKPKQLSYAHDHLKPSPPRFCRNDEISWLYSKSPTGRCYEIAVRSELISISGFFRAVPSMGISEIPCDEMPDEKLKQ